MFISSNGNSGGLALFWKDGVTLDVQSFAYDHIDAWIDGGSGIGRWHLTGFYGSPETKRRPEAWAKLKFLKNSSSLPWLVIGDFNKIIGLLEKERGRIRPKRQMELFLKVINFCALRDLGFVGPKFTWLYQQRYGFQIRERLNKALGSTDWMDLFPRATLHHLSSLVSNHSPLSLHLKNRPCKRSKRRLFRFESMWLKDAWCEEEVKEAWEERELLGSNWAISNYFDRCKVELLRWNKEEFGNVGAKVADLQAKLALLEIQPTSPNQIHALRKTRIELNFGWVGRMRCGGKGLGKIGFKVVIGTRSFFMQKLRIIKARTILTVFFMGMGCGTRKRPR